MANRTTPNPPARAGRVTRKVPPGHDVRSIGPSDSSDTGADMAGPGLLDDDMLGLDRGTNEDSEGGRRNVADSGPSVGDLGMDNTSDRYGTGERAAAGKEPDIDIGGDIGFDRVVGPDEAGLGGGLDQAEEAQLGVTDEELEASDRKRRTPRRPS